MESQEGFCCWQGFFSKQQELEQQESEQQESKQEKTEDSKNPADIASPKEEENEPDRKGFSMAFFGDTYYNRQRLWQYQNNGIKGLLDDSLIRLIAEADVAVLNHECRVLKDHRQITWHCPQIQGALNLRRKDERRP